MNKENKFYESLRLGIIEIWNKKWKALFLIIYIAVVGYFIKKYIIYDHTFFKNIPEMLYPIVKAIIDIFIENSSFSIESFDLIIQKIFYGFVWIIAFFGLLQVIIFIGMTYSASTTQSEFLNVNFPNGLIPKYISKKRDKERKHGKIITLECGGATKDDYEERISQIESALRFYKIYKIKQDKLDKSRMNIFCLPTKYNKPKIISSNTNFNDIFLLNLLLTGKSGSGKSTTLLQIMNIFANTYKNGVIVLVSYKPSEIFEPFKKTKNYYEFNNAKEGIEKAFNEMSRRMEDSNINGFKNNKTPFLFIIDEYPSLILSCSSKKESDEILNKVAIMLNVMREYLMFPLICANRRGFRTI